MHHSTLYCITLHHIAPYSTSLHHNAPHWPHCTTLHHNAPHCTSLHHNLPYCTTMHHIAPHCTTMHHIAPHCTTLKQIASRGLSWPRIWPHHTTWLHYMAVGSDEYVTTLPSDRRRDENRKLKWKLRKSREEKRLYQDKAENKKIKNKKKRGEIAPKNLFNKAGYAATPAACGWAGAVLEKVTRASGQELYAQKAPKRRTRKKGTDRPTDRHSGV